MFKEIKNYDYIHTTGFDFQALCELLANERHDLAVEQIKILAQEIESKNLYFDKGNYSRNVISNNDCWLGLLCWDKGAITRIHGHPEQSFIYILEGSLSCKSFDKEVVTELHSNKLKNGEFRYNKGIKGKMDNYIHQISATQKSISLHYYSDNPTKGEIFDI
ncbi:Cysteine dioxygenase type I [hydrothermal vent metagenome]|uniref:Cysteine dioxygenase type I n=1 Tax=hydrothermal vent metagenome TaxID=652676 RepID=A0A1W1DTN7_9ZZZZ